MRPGDNGNDTARLGQNAIRVTSGCTSPPCPQPASQKPCGATCLWIGRKDSGWLSETFCYPYNATYGRVVCCDREGWAVIEWLREQADRFTEGAAPSDESEWYSCEVFINWLEEEGVSLWRSVEEPPKDGQLICAAYDTGDVSAWRFFHSPGLRFGTNATRWMPIPELPVTKQP